MPALILASTSRYRKALLERLHLPFTTVAPEVDERRREDETASALVQRLAEAKARAVADMGHAGLIIGSDQVAVANERILGKPGDADKAIAQLRALSGQRVVFHTGLCLLDTASGRIQVVDETYQVVFRKLSDTQIHRYVTLEQPYDCAGAFRSEGLGIVLFEALDGRDPNSLIGLPLIALTDMLASAGILLPAGENPLSETTETGEYP